MISFQAPTDWKTAMRTEQPDSVSINGIVLTTYQTHWKDRTHLSEKIDRIQKFLILEGVVILLLAIGLLLK